MSFSKSFATMIGAVGLLPALAGCATYRVESYWGPAHKLSGLGSTYAKPAGAKCDPNAGESRYADIEATVWELIESEVTKRGYRAAADGKADFSVCYLMGKEVKQAEAGISSWDEAIVEVILTEPVTGERIWLGRVRARINYEASPGSRKSRLASAIRELMKPLPKAGV